MAEIAPLTGEPLALDLVNTTPRLAHAPVDLIATTAELRAWLALQADRLPDPPLREAAELTGADLAVVHQIRGHIALAIDHARRGVPPPEAALESLNDAQRAAPVIRHLAWDGQAVTATNRRTGPPGARLVAWLAEAAAGLLADPAVITIRQCEAEDCVMLFLPAHPRRRWCSATRCGNRARVARYYRRHKPART